MSTTDPTALQRLWEEQQQSAWLDNLRRSWLLDGTIRSWIDRGVRGITSNPSIFKAAIDGSDDYDEQLADELAAGVDIERAYWNMVIADISSAAQQLAPVNDRSGGRDGFVSVEVDPRLAHDTGATIAAAQGLVARLPHPNVMIKVPATVEGIDAIRALTAEGVSVNATLIFSLERYEAVLNAYGDGLQDALDASRSIGTINSVASFFVSRVDTEVDARLEKMAAPAHLLGRAAVTQARLAGALFRREMSSERWRALCDRGANPQRPLWASTSTKNPAYPDTLYVDSLIGPDTVNTIPDATLNAFLDHGTVERTLDVDPEGDVAVWNELVERVDMDDVADRLEREGVAAFSDAFADVLASLDAKAATL